MDPFISISSIAEVPRDEFEKICRMNASYAYMGDHRGVCVVFSKCKIFIDTRDISVAPHLIIDGYWESWLTQYFAMIVRPGDTCIDIGANFGYYSLLFSALSGKKGRTIAVEPNPGLCKLIRSTSNINGGNIEVAEVALSNRNGRIVLNIPESKFGDASIIKRNDSFFSKNTRVKVPMMTLDELVAKFSIEKVDVIKMDVEGVEPQVFDGMQKTLEANPHMKIVIEYSPHLYEAPEIFTEMLFDKFDVHQVFGPNHLEKIQVGAKSALAQLQDHTDLLLTLKP